MADEKAVRLSINISQEASQVIKTISSKKGVSITEAIRQAISVWKYFEEARERGAVIQLKENNTITEVIFIE